MEGELIVLLPHLRANQKLALWKWVSRNRGVLSLEKVLIVKNNVFGVVVAERLMKKLNQNLEDTRVLLVERPVFPSDWLDYKKNRAPQHMPARVSRNLRIRLHKKKAIRAELTLPGEP